jgi:hypothetical protein
MFGSYLLAVAFLVESCVPYYVGTPHFGARQVSCLPDDVLLWSIPISAASLGIH